MTPIDYNNAYKYNSTQVRCMHRFIIAIPKSITIIALIHNFK